MSFATVLDQVRAPVSADEYERIRDLWKAHSIAEDNRDIPGLLATLTDDCVYEIPQKNARWEGHAGAERFYTELLTAFPDIEFNLTNIVIGPQGVAELARATGTHRAAWLDLPPTGEAVDFTVGIFFPWDGTRQRFTGEIVHFHGVDLAAP